jgi:hypothetical protein
MLRCNAIELGEVRQLVSEERECKGIRPCGSGQD